MTLSLTQRALRKSQELAVEPNLVLCINGVSRCYGAIEIQDFLRYGDADVCYGEEWTYGGFRPIDDQLTAISFNSGTSTSIRQQ